MQKIFLLILCPILSVFCGCSTGSDYWQNRSDDAADIFTATAGGGFGVKAYAVGVQAAFYNYSPYAGLQGGEFFCRPGEHSENYHVNEGNIGIPFFIADSEIFYLGSKSVQRGKAYCGSAMLLPFFILHCDGISKTFCNTCYWKYRRMCRLAAAEYFSGKTDQIKKSKQDFQRQFYKQHCDDISCGGVSDLPFQSPAWSVYSDIHVVAAFFFCGFRVGVNAGELADFLLGWFGLDIVGDDL